MVRLLAHGDSWFDYPLDQVWLGIHTDTIAELSKIVAGKATIDNISHYGDSTVTQLGLKNQQKIIAALKATKYDALLISAGGDDIAGDAFTLWLRDYVPGMEPEDGLDESRFGAILDLVKVGYEDLFDLRDKYALGVPIFAHSYDFAIPNGVGALDGLIGPWMKPSLDAAGWLDAAQARFIVKLMLEEFAVTLDGLAAVPQYNFTHVKTQGTLADNQWANELHPTPDGFVLIANKIAVALEAQGLL